MGVVSAAAVMSAAGRLFSLAMLDVPPVVDRVFAAALQLMGGVYRMKRRTNQCRAAAAGA
jgi:hypothetical protein